MKSKIDKHSDRQLAKRFLIYGIASFVLITLVIFSGVLSNLIDSILSNNEGAGIAAGIIIYGLPPLISAIYLGRSYALFMDKPYAEFRGFNVFLIVLVYILIAISYWFIALIIWRYLL